MLSMFILRIWREEVEVEAKEARQGVKTAAIEVIENKETCPYFKNVLFR